MTMRFIATTVALMSILFCSLQSVSANAKNKSEGTDLQSPVPNGRSLFERNCSGCHGADGKGGEGPSLQKLGASQATVSNIITSGFKGEMPAFTKLKTSDTVAIALYVKSL